MKTTAKRAIVLLMMLSLLLSSLSTAMADDDDWYTYTYSYWGDEMASPNAYAVTNVIYAKDVDPELGSFSNPTSIFTIDDHVFICDTNNNRIVELIKKDGKYELVREIYTVEVSTLLADAMTFNGHVDPTLYNPTDIFVKKTTDKERAEHYNEYKGDPYVYPDVPETKTDDTKTDDTKTDETAAPEDKGEEKSDESAADDSATATSEGDEDGENGENGEKRLENRDDDRRHTDLFQIRALEAAADRKGDERQRHIGNEPEIVNYVLRYYFQHVRSEQKSGEQVSGDVRQLYQLDESSAEKTAHEKDAEIYKCVKLQRYRFPSFVM